MNLCIDLIIRMFIVLNVTWIWIVLLKFYFSITIQQQQQQQEVQYQFLKKKTNNIIFSKLNYNKIQLFRYVNTITKIKTNSNNKIKTTLRFKLRYV